MAYVKVLIHAVWSTKNRFPFFDKETRSKVWQHINENAKMKGIHIDRINGYSNHVHCLMYLNADMSLSKQVQLLKGESSFWLNRSGYLKTKFEWAEEYFAASVSDEKISVIRNYIDTQEQHHEKITFLEEYNRFMRHYGFEEGHG